MKVKRHTDATSVPEHRAASPRKGGLFFGAGAPGAVTRCARMLALVVVTSFAAACGAETTEEAASEETLAGDRLPPRQGEAASPPSKDTLGSDALGRDLAREQIELLLAWTEGATDRGAPADAPTVVLQGLDPITKDGFDRVTFRFPDQADMPGYRVRYTDGPTERCGGGDEIPLEEGTRILVRFQNAQAHEADGSPTIDFEGDFRQRRNLTDVHLVCDSDGALELALDLRGKRAYRVMEVRDPRRLVLDIRNTVSPEGPQGG